MASLRKIIYKLPPRVNVVSNPHYDSDGNTNYAPYTLESLGPYPLGEYLIGINGPFGGPQLAVESTNTSVTILYQKRPGTYPSKTSEQFMDILDWQFAYKKYRPPVTNGTTIEKLYHPTIFDFNPVSPGKRRLTFTTSVFFEKGFIPFDPNNPIKGFFYNRGDILNEGAVTAYGFAMVQIPDMPGFQLEATDPTPMNIVPPAIMSQFEGRYLIVVKNLGGFSAESIVDIYPNFPNDRNINISTISISQPKLGVEITIQYDSIYESITGPQNSMVFPYRYKPVSNFQPILIFPPAGTDLGKLRFYSKELNKKFVPFDIDTGDNLAAGQLVPAGSVPTNFQSFG